nr:hypothetical protein [Tanacetum cinerariifolium]
MNTLDWNATITADIAAGTILTKSKHQIPSSMAFFFNRTNLPRNTADAMNGTGVNSCPILLMMDCNHLLPPCEWHVQDEHVSKLDVEKNTSIAEQTIVRVGCEILEIRDGLIGTNLPRNNVDAMNGNGVNSCPILLMMDCHHLLPREQIVIEFKYPHALVTAIEEHELVTVKKRVGTVYSALYQPPKAFSHTDLSLVSTLILRDHFDQIKAPS